jgi:hypothetical protein
MPELLKSPTIIVFGSLLLICLMILAAIVAFLWYKVHKTEAETALKLEMIQRGMSAAEIQQVLKASTDRPAFWRKSVEEPVEYHR